MRKASSKIDILFGASNVDNKNILIEHRQRTKSRHHLGVGRREKNPEFGQSLH